jgi:transposase
VAKHTEAKKGFVLLPRRWVVERSFGWAARFRQLARGYERLFETLQDCTTSLSFAPCSVKPFLSSLQVHNRL